MCSSVGAWPPTVDGTWPAPTTPWRGIGVQRFNYVDRSGEGDGGRSNDLGHGGAEGDGGGCAGAEVRQRWHRPLRQRWRGPVTECNRAMINSVSSCEGILID
jgi:hypothetical protein